MKKLIAAVLTLCLLFSFAHAEETAEYNWADYEDIFENSDIEAAFLTFEDLGIKLLIPTALPSWELTQEEIDHGMIFYHADDNEEVYIGMTYVHFDTLESYHDKLKTVESVSDIRQIVINGIPAIAYQVQSNDSMSVAFLNAAGKMFEVTVRPLSEEGMKEDWDMVISSIQLVK